MDDEIDEIVAQLQKFERQQARRHKFALWCLIPYGAAGLAMGIGISNVANAGLRGTAVLLGLAFATFFSLSWIIPEVLHRAEQKDEGARP